MFLGSLLDLSKYGKGKGSTCRNSFDQNCWPLTLAGFVRERPDAPIPDVRRNSVESNTSRTYSDTSMGPPNGEHRELFQPDWPHTSRGSCCAGTWNKSITRPESSSSRCPIEIQRENPWGEALTEGFELCLQDLIEMVVGLQGQVDRQGRKVTNHQLFPKQTKILNPISRLGT